MFAFLRHRVCTFSFETAPVICVAGTGFHSQSQTGWEPDRVESQGMSISFSGHGTPVNSAKKELARTKLRCISEVFSMGRLRLLAYAFRRCATPQKALSLRPTICISVDYPVCSQLDAKLCTVHRLSVCICAIIVGVGSSPIA